MTYKSSYLGTDKIMRVEVHCWGFKGVNCRHFLGSLQAKDNRDGVVVKDISFGVRLPGLKPCPTHAVAVHS